jgi:predicted lysophospholipase L1 biosynthesis ABC-type transport system permease subunit
LWRECCQPGWQSWLLGPAASLLLLTGLALPPLLAIRNVSPLAVLRNELPLLRSNLLRLYWRCWCCCCWPHGRWMI